MIAGLKEKRVDVLNELKRLQVEAEPVFKIFEAEDLFNNIQNTRYVVLTLFSFTTNCMIVFSAFTHGPWHLCCAI